MHYPYRASVLASAAVALALVAGCAHVRPTYVDSSASYDAASALLIAEKVEPGEVAARPTSDAEDLRHESLVRLRRMGGDASRAAALITRTFPSDSTAVPVYVERAVFSGRPAWVIVEAIGRPNGKLSDERVWVLSDAGDVLLSGTR